MTPVTGTSPVTQSETGLEVSTKGKTLQTADFLQLLAAQLRYQNPLEPLDNTQFMGQLAQFSMLQELASLQDEVKQIREELQELGELETGRALALVGKEVKAQDDTGNVLEGIVTGVEMVNGVPWLMLGDARVSSDQVLEVRLAAGGMNEEAP